MPKVYTEAALRRVRESNPTLLVPTGFQVRLSAMDGTLQVPRRQPGVWKHPTDRSA